MKKVLLIWLLLSSASLAQTIIPFPQEFERLSGSFTINSNTKIFVNNSLIKEEAAWFADYFYPTTSIKLNIADKESSDFLPGNIYLMLDESTRKPLPEYYKLNISESNIILTAYTNSGIFYGLQTIRQLLPADIETKLPIDRLLNLSVPCCNIFDYPTYKWRGLLLDCSRHFMDKNFIKRYLDLLALHKFNRFHWHLTEDQGWRIEIKKYPKLTEIGAFRKEQDGSVYGGFYSQEDIKEIVNYASSLHITVIPEIEMPGHALAALASFPELSCTGGPFEVTNEWGVFKDVYCAGNDDVFTFLENVLDEVISLFPSQYIHIGGDEVPKFRWDNCPKCKDRMLKENLKNTDELQSYFIKRIEKYLNSKGRFIIGWDEILDGGLSPNATVQSWRGFEGGITAAKEKHYVIMSPTSHCYFDYPVSSIDLKKVYSFNPVPPEMTDFQSTFVLGGECNMWTEHAPQELVDSKLFPRILAMSESLWSNPATKNYNFFISRLNDYYFRLNLLKVDYGYETVPVKFLESYSESNKSFDISLSAGQPGLKLFYSLNDNPDFKEYSLPISLSDDNEVKVKVNSDRIKDTNIYSRSYSIHNAIGKDIKIIYPYSDHYKAGGNTALVNGLLGSESFRDGNWQGFNGVDMEIIVDLGSDIPVKEISAGFLQSNPSWIFMPEFVEYSVSMDGREFAPLPKIFSDVPQKQESNIIKRFKVNPQRLYCRYLKVFAKNLGVCPEWHNGAGGKTWIFCDEIIIK